MINLTNNSVETYTAAQAKEEIRNGIKAYLSKDANGNYFYDFVNRTPFYLEGPPGIGKSEIVAQVASELGIGFVNYSVTHHTRNSVIGLPVIENLEDGGKYTEYTMSEIIASVLREKEKGHTEGILLLDEFNCASEILMPVMLAFLQTRNIGLYKIPDEWVIVLCGNPSEYNQNAKRFTPAIMDRVRRMELLPDIDCFLEYAKTRNFHPLVLDYMKLYPASLYKVTNDKTGTQTVTPRGWENLSRTMQAYEYAGMEFNRRVILQYIKSSEIATDFWNFYWLNRNSFTDVQMNSIIEGNYSKDLLKLFEQGDVQFLDSSLDLIEKGLIKSISYETPKKASAKISNVFKFLKKAGGNPSAIEKFFFYLTENEELLTIVRKVKNDEYLEVARKMYGLEIKYA